MTSKEFVNKKWTNCTATKVLTKEQNMSGNYFFWVVRIKMNNVMLGIGNTENKAWKAAKDKFIGIQNDVGLDYVTGRNIMLSVNNKKPIQLYKYRVMKGKEFGVHQSEIDKFIPIEKINFLKVGKAIKDGRGNIVKRVK